MNSKLILIVDDDLDVRFVFAAILNYDGYRVMEAGNGERGVAYSISYQPDLILMDIRMPIMDGLTAAEFLRGHAETRGIPIVMISGSTLLPAESERAAGLFAGCLAKPLAPQAVVEEVTRLIGPPA
jgi:CheY-like chemotaxis protein